MARPQQADFFMNTTQQAPSMEEILSHGPNVEGLPRAGEMASGVVVAVDPGYVLISVQGVATGIIAGKERHDPLGAAGKVEVGEEVTAFVLEEENDDGFMVLSLRRAGQMRSWDHFEQCLADGTLITVTAKEANKGGLICDANGIHAFLPVSQLSPANYPRVDGANAEAITEKLAEHIGKTFTVRVITFLRGDKIIVSEREAMRDVREKELENLRVGSVVEGMVNGVVKFGLFVMFGNLEGLVHTSEISWDEGQSHYDQYHIGDRVRVMVLGKDTEKISLSIRRLDTARWKKLAAKYPVGTVAEGVVNRVTNFGFFVTIENEVSGLVHTSEFIDPEARPESVAKVDERVTIRVMEVNEEEQNLRLSLRLDGAAAGASKANKDEAKAKDAPEQKEEEGKEEAAETKEAAEETPEEKAE